MGYAVRPMPHDRLIVLEMLRGAGRRFPVHGLVELDVGRAAPLIEAADPSVSWTGFVIATLARVVARHPEVNARRAGKQIVLFDQVDIGATVERHVDGRIELDIATIREADRKSCAAITQELHRAKEARPVAPTMGLIAQLWRLPGPVRRTVSRMLSTRPRVVAAYGPAVGVTSLGMFSRGGGWGIPVPPLTVIVTVSGVVDRAVVRDGEVVVRPMLPLTLSFDHGVVDGAPAARFVETLRDLVETAAVLEEARARAGMVSWPDDGPPGRP
jgi:pyruvate/2-oxoglutarate dehydrogenase complex dihydrolipoamide acyltransferase (E2) component